uniref:F-box domain-containing protein n=1 Tax=Plectus sambesii TaxID=2011161 RepID=A0A914UHW8_9BILA
MANPLTDLVLSDPTWLRVLSFIGDPGVVCQLGCISRRWYRLSRDATLWRRVNFTERRRLSLKKLAMFIRRPLAIHMHSLRVEGFIMSNSHSSAKRLTVSPALLKELEERCPLLTELHLVNAKMDNIALDQFPERLTSLNFVGSVMSFDFLASLTNANILPRLTAIDLSYVHNLSSFSKSLDGLLSRT